MRSKRRKAQTGDGGRGAGRYGFAFRRFGSGVQLGKIDGHGDGCGGGDYGHGWRTGGGNSTTAGTWISGAGGRFNLGDAQLLTEGDE